MDNTVLKGNEKKLAKIAVYGRAHKGPRKRRKKRDKVSMKQTPSVTTKASRLPLVNAEETASSVALNVLGNERVASAKKIATNYSSDCITAALTNVQGISEHLKESNSMEGTGKPACVQRPKKSFSKLRATNGNRQVKSRRRQHGRASSFVPFRSTAPPDNWHSRAQSMTFVSPVQNGFKPNAVYFGSHSPPMVANHSPSLVSHAAAYSTDFPAQVHYHRPTSTFGGWQAIRVGKHQTSFSQEQVKHDRWSVSQKPRAVEGTREATCKTDETISLEQLVQDLALVLPDPMYAHAVVSSGSSFNPNQEGPISDNERNERVALAIKLAEDERDRRVSLVKQAELEEVEERRRRIHFAVEAIEAERLQRSKDWHTEDNNPGGPGSPTDDYQSVSSALPFEDDYEVVCPFSMLGCEATSLRSNLSDHLNTCSFRLNSADNIAEASSGGYCKGYNPLDHVVMCPFRVVGCSFHCARASLPEHLLECQFRPEANKNEMDFVLSSKLGSKTSDLYEVVCPYTICGCEHICLRANLQQHLQECQFHCTSRQEEEAERQRNKRFAIAAAEVERQRRVQFLRSKIQMSTERGENRDNTKDDSNMLMRRRRAECIVKAAQIEKIRLVCEEMAKAQHLDLSSPRLTQDQYDENWGYQSDGSVVIISDREDESHSASGSRISAKLLRRLLDDHDLLLALGQEITEMSSLFTHENTQLSCLVDRIVLETQTVVAGLWAGRNGTPKVEVFGSMATGLAVPGISDIDLVVTVTGECIQQMKSPTEKGKSNIGTNPDQPSTYPVSNIEAARWVRASAGGISADRLQAGLMCGLLGRALRSVEWVSHVKVIDTAKVPVIKLTLDKGWISAQTSAKLGPMFSCITEARNMEIDLTFAVQDHVGKEAVLLIKDMVLQKPSLVPLSHVLKWLLAEKDLNNPFSGGLSSYALVLMVSASLSDAELQDGNPVSIARLLLNFLELYGNSFNSSEQMVSYKGGSLDWRQVAIVPRPRVPAVNGESGSFGLIVLDPLRAGNNVGRTCFAFPQVQRAFSNALTTLGNNQGIWRAYKTSSGKFTLLRRMFGLMLKSDS